MQVEKEYDKMTDQYRIIRKEINLTPEELEQIQKLMKQIICGKQLDKRQP